MIMQRIESLVIFYNTLILPGFLFSKDSDDATQINSILSLGRFRVFCIINEDDLDIEINKINNPSQFGYVSIFNSLIIGMQNNYQNGYGVQLKCSYNSSNIISYRFKTNGSWSNWVTL